VYHVVSIFVFYSYQQPTLVYVMFIDIRILMLLHHHQCHENQIHGYMYSLCLMLYHWHYWAFFFRVFLRALRVICVFVFRSLIVTRMCKIIVFTCWLTHTSYTYTNKNVNPECASSISLCGLQFVYDAVISIDTRMTIKSAIRVK
jgi:hypothetical protein